MAYYGYNNTYNCHIIDIDHFGGMGGFVFRPESFVVYNAIPSRDATPDASGAFLPTWNAFFASFKRWMNDDDLGEDDYEAVIWLWSKYFSPKLKYLTRNGTLYGGVCLWVPKNWSFNRDEIIQRVRVTIRAHRLEFDE